MSRKNSTIIETLAVLIKASDGKVYQALIKKKTEEVVRDVIRVMEGEIKVFHKPLEGIEIKQPL